MNAEQMTPQTGLCGERSTAARLTASDASAAASRADLTESAMLSFPHPGNLLGKDDVG